MQTVQILDRINKIEASGKFAHAHEPLNSQISAMVTAGLLTATTMKAGPLGLPAHESRLRLTDIGRKMLAE